VFARLFVLGEVSIVRISGQRRRRKWSYHWQCSTTTKRTGLCESSNSDTAFEDGPAAEGGLADLGADVVTDGADNVAPPAAFGEPHKIAAAALYRDIGMALAARSALVGVRDRVRTRNASCTPRLVHVSADGVLPAQLLTCNRAICPFLPFRASQLRCANWLICRDFAMARPGLEPGTPRFSGRCSAYSNSGGTACKHAGSAPGAAT
jgi:hypothetical protein